jgi:hypothetical protein
VNSSAYFVKLKVLAEAFGQVVDGLWNGSKNNGMQDENQALMGRGASRS